MFENNKRKRFYDDYFINITNNNYTNINNEEYDKLLDILLNGTNINNNKSN